MNSRLRVAFIPLARPTFDTVLAAEMAARARRQLTEAGMSLLGPEQLVMDAQAVSAAAAVAAASPDLLLLFQASFADSSMALSLAQAIDAPVLLWAVPEAHTGGRLRLNSFCGINLAGHALRRAGIAYDHLYAPPDDPDAVRRIVTLAQAGHVRRLLATARVGRLGDHPAGFEPCSYDAPALRALLGVEVERLELPDVFAAVRATARGETDAVLEQLKSRLAGLDQLDQSAIHGTLGTYRVLSGLAGTHRLDGIAVRCWPEFFTDLGCAACGAISLLTDDGVPCSCEADVNGTISEMILHWLSGEAAFGTDIVSADQGRDAAVIWHCGLAPLTLADPEFQPRATIHSNRHLPLLMEFPLKPGRVTVARLSQAGGLFRLVIGGGEMLRAPLSFSGTSGVLRFDRSVREVFDTILAEGLEHHVAITYGDHVDALLALAKMLGLPVLRLS